MKKALILFIVMGIFTFSCTLVERDKNKTDDAIEIEDSSVDSIESDIFDGDDSIPSDSISRDSASLVQ